MYQTGSIPWRVEILWHGFLSLTAVLVAIRGIKLVRSLKSADITDQVGGQLHSIIRSKSIP